MYNFSLVETTFQGAIPPLYTLFPFLDENGLKLKGAPMCGITLASAGSMRFRWNEENPNRDNVISEIENNLSFASSVVGKGNSRTFVPVQLDHTKIVYRVDKCGDSKGKVGDGLLTLNRDLVPTVTVADCVPIYLYDCRTKAFGIVHSGWKGTGIGAAAIDLAKSSFGSRPEDFYVVIGPHIKSCCYIVNQERADYFSREFCRECIKPLEPGVSVDWNNGGGKLYRLSLDIANVAMFKKAGVPDNHIAVCSDCTCCNDIYGSNRRETRLAGKPDAFTVMAAFISA